MAKRAKLRPTNADYVAIAVSPALIMALVGSLVFFLIEVLYVGQYSARLNYVFALFVFATVLIGRISIEMGAERAALFALPLGVAMFLVLAKFVEHASPYSHLINIGLPGIVWWSTHKLTWDCTLIDENEDASGEGLLQRAGVDELASEDTGNDIDNQAENELFVDEAPVASPAHSESSKPPTSKKKQPHAPGLWVLYFSLAALPLFGIGQKWIPPADVGRRQYAFGLLAIYVAAGLTLLVTTSFLGLRRYLRQRRVEMPTPMAATWVVTGAALIGVVMLLAALIPRPHAEYAISQVPWQAGSPLDLASARRNLGQDGTEDADAEDGSRKVTSEQSIPDGETKRDGENPTTSSNNGKQQSSGGESEEPNRENSNQSQSSESRSTDESQSASDQQSEQAQSSSDEAADSQDVQNADDATAENSRPTDSHSAESKDSSSESKQAENATTQESSDSAPSESPTPPPSLPDLVPLVGGLAGILKLIMYVVLAFVLLYLAWRNRVQIARAVADMVRQIREFLARLFGGQRAESAMTTDDNAEKTIAPPPRPFSSFADPFSSGHHASMPPDELVRHTFEAFEAWARERGHPRSVDQTPLELVRRTVPQDSPMLAEAVRLTRLYGEAAYAPQAVSAEAAGKLGTLWTLMRQPAQTPVESVP